MPTPTVTPDRLEAVTDLFDVLIRFKRALSARASDWGNDVNGLSRGDIVSLGVLDSRGSSRPGQIAAVLNVGPSVVSRQLVGLERLGLITRGVDPDDGRAELITLTDPGRERLLEARGAMCSALAERLDHWDVDDITRATAMVEDLADRLHSPHSTKEDHA